MLDERDLKAIGELFDSRIQVTETKLTERLDGVDRRLDGVDKRLEGVDRRLDGVDKRLEGVDKRLDGVDRRLDELDRKIDGVETKLTKRIDDVEAKLTERIDGVEKKLDSSVKFLTDAIAEVDANSLRHLNNEISRLDKRLDNMEQSFRIIRLENSQNHEILNILVDHQKRIETLETQMAL